MKIIKMDPLIHVLVFRRNPEGEDNSLRRFPPTISEEPTKLLSIVEEPKEGTKLDIKI